MNELYIVLSVFDIRRLLDTAIAHRDANSKMSGVEPSDNHCIVLRKLVPAANYPDQVCFSAWEDARLRVDAETVVMNGGVV